MDIRTTGDLRRFLGGVLVDLRGGKIEPNVAGSLAKIAQQINQSISTEINAAIALRQLGGNEAVAGSMLLIGVPSADAPKLNAQDQDGLIWCDQCDMRVTAEQATGCKSKHCKAKA